jgi:hypothetical protein
MILRPGVSQEWPHVPNVNKKGGIAAPRPEIHVVVIYFNPRLSSSGWMVGSFPLNLL